MAERAKAEAVERAAAALARERTTRENAVRAQSTCAEATRALAALQRKLSTEQRAATAAKATITELEQQLVRVRDREGIRRQRREWREKVVSLYKEHNPKKLPEVDGILARYFGQEQLLLDRLQRKYVGGATAGLGLDSSGVDSDVGGERGGGAGGGGWGLVTNTACRRRSS